jgi:hypothetical protein
MANHEDRPRRETVDLLLAFYRKKDNQSNKKCIRMIINDFEKDLQLLEYRCRLLGGHWRIHQTVNKRDTKKARIWFLHKLIDTDVFDGCLDSLWRTALLQKENAAENNFLLDVDTNNSFQLDEIERRIPKTKIIKLIQTPSGWHYITKAFDTRKVCELPYVTLIKDGYYFIKEIKGKDAL